MIFIITAAIILFVSFFFFEGYKIFLLAAAILIFIFIIQKAKASNVVTAELVDKFLVQKKDGRNYYKYYFKVEYKDGTKEVIECEKGDAMFNSLIKKLK